MSNALPDDLAVLFARNREWADRCCDSDPAYFARLTGQQNPRYLWIGCADSRVPANEIVGLEPGEIFVHRNVANLVPHADMNALSVLQYAVDVLRVEHILVVGHYGCGGVRAAYENQDHGLIDNWLRNIKDTIHHHRDELSAITDEEARINRLCEISVINQVHNAASTTIVQNAWHRGQKLDVHGWVYSLSDGLLHDLGCSLSKLDDIHPDYRISPAI